MQQKINEKNFLTCKQLLLFFHISYFIFPSAFTKPYKALQISAFLYLFPTLFIFNNLRKKHQSQSKNKYDNKQQRQLANKFMMYF